VTITVGVDTFVTVAEADTYLRGAWSAFDTADKESALVEAARSMETLTWKGSKTSEAQALAWPRTGVVDRYGRALDPNIVPTAIKNGQIEWAFYLTQNPGAFGATNFASNDKRYKAGPVEIEFWRPERGIVGPRRSLRWFWDLLLWSSQFAVSYASGTGEESFFSEDDFDRSEPFP
jgi:hypothetical protein